MKRRQVFGIVVLTIIVIGTGEAMLSGTDLITPISPLLVNTMRGVGALLGLALGVYGFVSPQPGTYLLKQIFMLLTAPLLLGFVGDRFAWRVADWAEFGFSSQPFTAAPYAIIDIHYAKRAKRDRVSIDPFGLRDSAFIPVPSSQYEALRYAADYGCIIVLQRRNANGAVEIKTDGEITWSEPEPAKLVPCQ